MRISEKGLALIKRFEGYRPRAYVCSGGKWTIGYGHTASVNPQDSITIESAERLLQEDCLLAEMTVASAVKVALSRNQFDALVSFVFNVGRRNFIKSTLLKKLNTGDVKGAADEFLKWTYAKGKKSDGLLRRRKAERELFLHTD